MKFNSQTGLLIFAFACLIVSSGCDDQDHGAFQMDSIVGKWKDSTKKHAYFEKWTKTDSGFSGNGYVLAESDTVFIENLRIEEVGDLWHYYAQVHNQNEGDAVLFKEVENTESRIVFSNQDHEFPQRIAYTIRNDSLLNVLVDGEERGKYRKLEFEFEKIEE